MKSIAFPNMLGTYKTNISQDKTATTTNLNLTLLSSKGALFGDPYFGTNLNRFLYEQGDTLIQDLVIDDIYSAILAFMPQLVVKRNDISLTVDRDTVRATVKAINLTNQQIDLYNITLAGEE